ncbi:hypothetical protein HMPREF3038_02523 [Akkermansia sp. KLE1797]|nr:hypothetical protein HMPREF3038_02523 [Akkermansia sp. KLE1797]
MSGASVRMPCRGRRSSAFHRVACAFARVSCFPRDGRIHVAEKRRVILMVLLVFYLFHDNKID